MNYDAVLFDAAETLFTTRGSVGEIYGAVASRFGSSASAESIQEAFVRHFKHSGPLTTENEKQWWKEIVSQVFTDVGMVDEFDAFFDQVYELFGDSRGWTLFPETREVLDTLKAAQLHLGVISNFDSRLYSVLRDLRIQDFFDSITICSEVGYAKPQPEIFHVAVKSLSAPIERVLFVGDHLVDDFQGATNAGLQAVLVDRAGRYAAMRSVQRIASLLELVPLLGLHREGISKG